jgi:TPR repeat protein
VAKRRQYGSHVMGSRHGSQHGILSNIEGTTSVSSSSGPSKDYGEQAQSAPISDASSTSSGNNMQAAPPLQYHHLQNRSEDSGKLGFGGQGNELPAGNGDNGANINRHLTPISSNFGRRSFVQRPASAYSIGSDYGTRGRSPVMISQSPSWSGRALSAHSGTPDGSRPASYVDLLNAPYPQPPPVPHAMFDNSGLRSAVGSNASLLSTQKTLEMYRLNVKKTNDAQTQYAFALLLIDAAREIGLGEPNLATGKHSPKLGRDLESPYVETAASSSQDLLREARAILQKLADRSYPYAQYYLADGYASGLFNKGKEDYDRAFPLFTAASKHGHAESGYRAALCYEFGWGCRKDPAKAVQYYRQSASKNHPGAMTRLGRACLSGDLGLNKYREGLKWLKRATDSADPQYNAAPYHLGLLYETGYGDDVFQDETYAAQLFTQAADLGHAEACYKLGDAYEHGKLSCPRDPALSVHFYTGAAQKGQASAMMALCAWYMVGAEPVLEKDENEAYEWARRAAECGKYTFRADFKTITKHQVTGLTKAEYAVGYFTEMGIGCRRDPLEANVWYVRAAEAGDERAQYRLAAIRATASGGIPMEVAEPRSRKGKKLHAKTSSLGDVNGPTSPGLVGSSPGPRRASGTGSPKKDDKECVVM